MGWRGRLPVLLAVRGPSGLVGEGEGSEGPFVRIFSKYKDELSDASRLRLASLVSRSTAMSRRPRSAVDMLINSSSDTAECCVVEVAAEAALESFRANLSTSRSDTSRDDLEL